MQVLQSSAVHYSAVWPANVLGAQESGYRLSKRKLELLSPPQQAFKLSIATRIDPANNTALEVKRMGTPCVSLSVLHCISCTASGQGSSPAHRLLILLLILLLRGVLYVLGPAGHFDVSGFVQVHWQLLHPV